MAPRPKIWTLISTDDKHDPVYETYRDIAELEERLASIEPDDPSYLLVEGEVVPFTRKTTISIGTTMTVRKERKKRADAGTKRKAKDEPVQG